MSIDQQIAQRTAAIERLIADLRDYHPRAAVLFGSMARHLAGIGALQVPNDIDVMVIGDNPPLGVEATDYGFEIELHRFQVYQFVDIAKSLRYDTRPVALSKLYGSVLARQHAKSVIAACLLLGPTYNDFGIEQIEVDNSIDERDYSIHQVLIGRRWWKRITAYARDRRGPLKRFSDKIVRQYEFEE